MHRSFLNSTNSHNHNINTKAGIFQRMCLSAIMVFLLFSGPAFATNQQDAQNELNQINSDIGTISSTLNSLRAEKNTLANELAILDAQAYSIQLQINSAQAQINVIDSQIADTNAQVAQAEANLQKQKELLQEYIKTMYMSSQTSQIELILTSNNFSDFVDQTQYLDTMTQKVQDATNQIESLKKELEAKKRDLQIKMNEALQLKATQVSAQTALNMQVEQKASLLQTTKGNESAYQSSLNGKIARRGILECIASGGCGGDASGQLQVVNSGTHYYQWQDPWGPTSYTGVSGDGNTFANYGCLITSLGMAHGLTPPQEAARHSFTGDGYMISDGSSGTSIGLDWARVNSILSTPGGEVIFGLHMGGYDHYVVAVGMTDGKYLINDPYFQTGYTYNASRVFKALIP